MSVRHDRRPLGLTFVALSIVALFAAQAHAGSLTFTMDLRTGTADAPVPPFITFKDPPADKNRDGWYEAVLRINLNDPKIGNPYRVVEFQVEYDAEPAGQVNLNIGDSSTNNSGGGDSGTQANDAEINIGNGEGHCTDLDIFGKDATPIPGNILERVPGFVGKGVVVRFTIGDQYLSWSNNRGRCGKLSSPHLFALGGQADREGPVNYELYAAFNRVISGPYRLGSGVRRVTVVLSPRATDEAGPAGVGRTPMGAEATPRPAFAGSTRRPGPAGSPHPTPATDRAEPAPAAGEPRSIRLPEVADHVLAAGGGRYLLLQFPKLMKVGVFDLKQDRIVGYLPLPNQETVVAGGLHKVVLATTDKKVVQRWSLEPLRRELTVPLDVPGQIECIAMGHASEGPILVTTDHGPAFLSLQALKPLKLAVDGKANWSGRVVGAASADGQTFAGWARGVSPSGVRLLQIRGDKLAARYEHATAGVPLPSWDGTCLFASSNVYDSDLHPVGGDRFRGMATVPALHPAYFVAVPLPSFDPRQDNTRGPAIYTVADRTRLIDLDPMPELVPEGRPGGIGYGDVLSVSERIFLAPQHERLVTLASSRDRLVSRRFDLIAALDRAGIDYLFIDSVPPTIAEPGRTYRYRIQVRSRAGGVKFTLDSGPEGMVLTRDGVLEWDAPNQVEPGRSGVIITVEDATGQTLLHSFIIRTEGESRPSRPPQAGSVPLAH